MCVCGDDQPIWSGTPSSSTSNTGFSKSSGFIFQLGLFCFSSLQFVLVEWRERRDSSQIRVFGTKLSVYVVERDGHQIHTWSNTQQYEMTEMWPRSTRKSLIKLLSHWDNSAADPTGKCRSSIPFIWSLSTLVSSKCCAKWSANKRSPSSTWGSPKK